MSTPVYKWQLSDGTEIGCGTQAEFDHWLADGVLDADTALGAVIAHEHPSVDERRKAAWAAEVSA